jgi:hypothetical protein
MGRVVPANYIGASFGCKGLYQPTTAPLASFGTPNRDSAMAYGIVVLTSCNQNIVYAVRDPDQTSARP